MVPITNTMINNNKIVYESLMEKDKAKLYENVNHKVYYRALKDLKLTEEEFKIIKRRLLIEPPSIWLNTYIGYLSGWL